MLFFVVSNALAKVNLGAPFAVVDFAVQATVRIHHGARQPTRTGNSGIVGG